MARGSLSFTAQVKRTLETYDMIAPDERVMVAVSGGADSVALLYALRDLGVPLEVAHFDHQTRGGESAEDTRFVLALTEKLKVRFHTESQPVEAGALIAGLSFEQYAREVRYAFLRRITLARGCAALATAHHADDQAETMLMRILRGTTPAGITGIPVVRVEAGVRIIRPLFYCARPAIEHWLRERGVEWREDESNRDPQYLRNRVRHVLIPELRRSYNPQLREALMRLAEAQRCENDLLSRLTAEAIKECVDERGAIDREAFSKLHEALRRRGVVQLAWQRGIDCPFDRVVEACEFIDRAPTGQRFDLGGGVQLYNGRTHTELVRGGGKAPCATVQLRVPGVTEAFGRRFEARLLLTPPSEGLAQYCTPRRQVFDADAMAEGVWVRARLEGDRFTPLGMSTPRKLSDYLVDIGLPAPQRETHPLLVTRSFIAWIVGHASSAQTAVTPLTRRILEIEVTECE